MTRPPNIILIHADQHRGDCLSIAGHPEVLTPNLDALASGGARMTAATTPAPVCCPARHCMLTGCSPATNGVLDNQPARIARPHATLPALLRDAGYQTVHIGRTMHQHPASCRYGFEHVHASPADDPYSRFHREIGFTSHAGEFDKFPHFLSHGLPQDGYTARDWPYDETLHQTTWTVNSAISAIDRRDRDDPLFLSVGFVAPHPPLLPPRFYFDRYRGMDLTPPVVGDWVTPPEDNALGMGTAGGALALGGEAARSARAAYLALINHLDDQLHNLIHRIQLEQEPTYIIYLSDHGEMLGDHHRFRKSRPFEGSVRIPWLLAGPDVPAGTVIDRPVTLEDLLPTCLDAAGLSDLLPERVEGRSLMPLVRGDGGAAAGWRGWTHSESPPTGHFDALLDGGGWHALTDGRMKYIWFVATGREMLFALTDDPHECRDLSAEPGHQATLGEWRGRLVERLADRPEGFVADGGLVAGVAYHGLLPHAVPVG